MKLRWAATPPQRKLWIRILMMILFWAVFHLAGWMLLAVTLLQLILLLITREPNLRLQSFGSSLGNYFFQIARFVSLADEQAPFPFNDWPRS